MKINKIRIRNINSLRGDWVLDFTKDPFAGAMLFSITGPTGSGKSTLLDAVTLALYNQIPRIDKSLSKTMVEEGGFILSRNETECSAEVEYSCKTGAFRSSWSISVNRNGNLREYEMEIADLATGQILENKKRLVPETNASLIGLNYDQFIRSILLSQGGFSRFLDAKKEERAKLLEQITGTDLYRKIGIKAFETWRDKNKSIEKNETLIEDVKKELIDQGELEIKKTELDLLSNELDQLKNEKEKLRSLGIIKQSIARLNKQLKENENNLEKLKTEEAAFSLVKQKRLTKHRALAPYSRQIEQHHQFLKDQKEAEALIPLLEQEKEEKEMLLKTIKTRVETFIGRKIIEEETEKALQHFRAEIVEKEKIKTQTSIDFEYQHKKLNICLKKKPLDLIVWGEDYVTISDILNSKEQEVNKALLTLRETGITGESLQKTKEETAARKEALFQLKGSVGHYKQLNEEIKQIEQELKRYSSLLLSEESITELENTFEEVHNAVEQQNNRLIQIREENSANIIALRNTLRENEPCMVCGSVHHPYIHEYVNDVNKELDVLTELKKRRDEVKKKLENAKASNGLHTQLLTKSKNELLQKEEDLRMVEAEVGRLKKTAGIEEVKTADKIDLLLQAQEQILSDIHFFETNNELLLALKEARSELKQATDKKEIFEIASNELLSSYKGNNILKETEDFLNEINLAKNLLSETSNKIDLNRKQLNNTILAISHTENEILDFVQALGYSTISESNQDLLDHGEFISLDGEEKNITGGIRRFEELISQSKTLLQAEQENDDPAISEEFCKERLAQLLPELEKKEQEKNNLSTLIKTDAEKRKKINLLEEEIASTREANKKWNYLNQLIGDATGNRFNSFAQKFTLAKLVKLANVHLRKLNERYVLDMPGIGEEEDLITVDGWMGEERRSVKTLSGGEKFLISLSLALALSDLASRHVKIESLFIDEGFGTLDPETLDQAISTLEQLQSSSGKSVGIISHVEELKERIQTQIRLEKSAAGFSTIHILPEQ